ncbi:MAG: hypothetical protein QOK49_2822, partial [Baekduia sp.]|nr:hypothetical protein [Baekduia sp.]
MSDTTVETSRRPDDIKAVPVKHPL